MKIRSVLFISLQIAMLSTAIAKETHATSSLINQPIALTTSDGKARTISSCDEFIMLRQNNLLIKDVNIEPNSAYKQARNALTDCNLKWQASSNKLSQTKSLIKDTSKYFDHLPANVVLAVSNDDIQKKKELNENASFKSIRPDLKKEGDAMVSDANKEKYVIINDFILSGNGKDKSEIVVITASSTEGTYSETTYYKVVDKNKSVWKLKPVDWNSNL